MTRGRKPTARRRIAALLAAVACACALLAGCGNDGEEFAFSVCVGDEAVTYDPIYAESAGDQTVIAHLYENLMRLTENPDGTLSVTGGAAQSVDVRENGDGTVNYTFHLRETEWSDGMALRAADFVYAWQRLADPASASPYAALLSIVSGYDAARATGDMDLLAVTEKNNRTLVVTLDGHYDWFLREVCTSPATVPLRREVVQRLKHVAEERNEKNEGEDNRWWFDPTLLVTNGPYRATAAGEGYLKLTRNTHYAGRTRGADVLTFCFADAEGAQALYADGTVQLCAPTPEETMRERAEKDETWAAEPLLETYCVLFNGNRVTDPRVRAAMGLALDRVSLAQTMGAGAAAAEGLVPPCVPQGDGTFRENGKLLIDNHPETYEARCEEARTLLAQAEQDDWERTDLEYLYEEGGGRDALATALCKTWSEVLHLRVTPSPLPKQELMSALREGKYTLAGLGVSAVCCEAECFLMNWTSESGENLIAYENSAYDTLMSIIAAAADGSARMGCLHDAEELLVKIDSAICPVCTEGTAWELRAEYVGARRDARGWFDLTEVKARPNNL
ncbi:MAG: peptide ABC transporter substrate-binding protein [Oscillibacter sp.]|nr:peptide ABC transporter substrate-binding protein [Oscillibacter sp.]